MNEKKQDKIVNMFVSKFENYNTNVLRELGKVIKQFEKLTPTQAHKLAQQLKYSKNLEDIIKELSNMSRMSMREVQEILEQTAKDNLGFAETYYEAKGMKAPLYEENKAIKNIVNAISNQTNETFSNISRSTGFRLLGIDDAPMLLSIDETYKEVIDRCVYAIETGQETYQAMMRKTLNELKASGVRKIEYESGYSQRLDSVIRRNILDGIRQVSNETQQEYGKQFGANGVEVSVHLNPAPDHEFVQGKQFSLKEFDNFQNNRVAKSYDGMVFTPDFKGHDRRSISELNCYHYVFSVVLGAAKPLYSNEQLEQIRKDKDRTFEFEGKTYNMYEGTQLQRKIETAIRREKDNQILYRSSGFEDDAMASQKKINDLTRKYSELSKTSGLKTQKQRMTVSGYRRIKAN